MKNAVIYARYSSLAQTEQSIEGQLRECRAFAEQNGYHVIGEYIDRAFSGKTDHRPDFQRMIQDSKKRTFQYVIVWKLDRFARNRYDSATYKHILKKNGVRVISATEKISDSPEGVILEAMLEGMAEFYSLELSAKVKRGNRENYLKGLAGGGQILFGYKLVNKKVFPDEIKAPILREWFDRYVSGEPSLKLYKDLKAKYPAIRFPCYSAMIKGLSNRKYLGEFQVDGVFYDVYPALIDPNLFERAQRRLEQHKHSPASEKAEIKYLLSGKLFCGACGEKMVGLSGTSRNGERHAYYVCKSRIEHRGCKKNYEKKDFLEWYVTEQTVAYVLDPQRIDYIAGRVVELHDREYHSSGLASAERQLAALQREKEKTLDAFIHTENQKIKKTLEEKFEQLDDQVEELSLEIQKLKKIQKIRLSKDQVIAWIKLFTKGDPMDMAFREKIIEAFVSSVYAFDDKFVIYFNVKDGKLVSYVEVLEDLEDIENWDSPIDNMKSPDIKCSYLTSLGPPRKPYREFFAVRLFALYHFGFLFYAGPVFILLRTRSQIHFSLLFSARKGLTAIALSAEALSRSRSAEALSRSRQVFF